MVLKWTVAEIAQAVGGVVMQGEADALITGVEFDSRRVTAGDLFVPLQAERDGHEFIEQAFKVGAVASFWQRDVDTEFIPADIVLIAVDNTQQAMEDFAQYYLQQVSPKVIAVTGSNGKTTTKDIIASLSAQTFITHKTQGNFNNHIGVPKTILDMPRETEVLVIELGMDHAGEIDHLSRLVQPDIAVITMIGESHIEFLGSRENIARAKMEIINGLDADGLLIYPADEPLIANHLPQFIRSIGFSLDPTATVYASHVQSDVNAVSFETNLYPNEIMRLNIPGSYNVRNALAALIVAKELGVSLEELKRALGNVERTKNRLEWIENDQGIWILNDAYNASPTSMKSALQYFQTIPLQGRKLAVLGDMLELGSFSEGMHRDLGRSIDEQQLDVLYLYGEQMKVLYQYVKTHLPNLKVYYFKSDRQEMTTHLQKHVKKGDHILVKSSFGTGLRFLVEDLLHSGKSEETDD